MEQEQSHLNLQEGFKERTGGVTSNWRPSKPPEKTHLYFGLVRGQGIAIRVKLLFRNGERFSFSYALLPVISFSPTDGLSIMFSDYEVIIKGRGLQILEEHLSQESVVWIKTSPSGKDDGSEEIFIEDIFVNRQD